MVWHFWRLVDPFFIDDSLNPTKYHVVLSNEIRNFLDAMPLKVLHRIAFHQHGAGATPHNARMNVTFLNNNFDVRWVGTYGPMRWPAKQTETKFQSSKYPINNVRTPQRKMSIQICSTLSNVTQNKRLASKSTPTSYLLVQ